LKLLAILVLMTLHALYVKGWVDEFEDAEWKRGINRVAESGLVVGVVVGLLLS